MTSTEHATTTKPIRALVDSKWGQTAIQVGTQWATTIHSLSPASVALALSAANALKDQLPAKQQVQVDKLVEQLSDVDGSIALVDDTIESSKSTVMTMIEEKKEQAQAMIEEKKEAATASISLRLDPLAERLEPIVDSVLPEQDETEEQVSVEQPSPSLRLTGKVSKRIVKRWQTIAGGLTNIQPRLKELAHLDLIAYDKVASNIGGAVSTSLTFTKKSFTLASDVIRGEESVEGAWDELLGTLPAGTKDFAGSISSQAGELITSTRTSFTRSAKKAKQGAVSAAASANIFFEERVLPMLPRPIQVIWADLLIWRANLPELAHKKLADAQSESTHELKQLPEGATPVEPIRPPADQALVVEDVAEDISS